MLHHLSRLADLHMRVAALDGHLRRPATEAVGLLDELLAEADEGQAAARQVAVALAIWRAGFDDEARLVTLREASRSVERVAPLFSEARARHELSPHAHLDHWVSGRELSRWFRSFPRQRAFWTHHLVQATMIPRLQLGFELGEVARLLGNPRCGLDMVTALATHRPVPAAMLRDIAVSTRWMPHVPVRAALCHNPFTPPALVHALRASLPRPSRTGSGRPQ